MEPAPAHPTIPAQTTEPLARAPGFAVLSLLCSLASVGACCSSLLIAYFFKFPEAFTAIIALPILGILGITFGYSAFRRVKHSGGAVMGRNAAIMGIFLGLISVVLQGAFITGILIPAMAVKRQLVPVAERIAAAAPALDAASLDDLFPPATPESAASRTRILAAIDEHTSPPRAASFTFDTFFRSRGLIADARARGFTTGPAPSADPPRPVEITSPTSSLLLLLFLDKAALDDDRILIHDLIVVREGHAATILLPDGPAREYADYLGLAVDPL